MQNLANQNSYLGVVKANVKGNLSIWTNQFKNLEEFDKIGQQFKSLDNENRGLEHLVSVPQWGLLNYPGNMSSFPKFSGVRSSSKFSTGKTAKPIRDKMKIQ